MHFKLKKMKYIYIILLFSILFLSVGWSVFNSNLMIDNITAIVRPTKDIRVTGVSINNLEGDATSDWQDYNVRSINSSIHLPKEDSKITFKVQITNIGGSEMGILNITGLPDNLEYKLLDYQLKDKLCIDEEKKKCSLGIQKEILITIQYKTYIQNQTDYQFNLIFDFRPFHSIEYTNINNNGYPKEVIDGGSLDVTFIDTITSPILVVNKTTSDKVPFNYSNNHLEVNNVDQDLEVVQIYPQEFKYTGNYQTFKVKYPGTYQIELWGASGGNGSGNGVDYIYVGGLGAYTKGNITLNKDDLLYVYVGGRGADHTWDNETMSAGGFNGGGKGNFDSTLSPGSSDSGGGGGGATDVRFQGNSLNDRIMVAAGAGGGAWSQTTNIEGENGGGLYVKGLALGGSWESPLYVADGTQTTGSSFGIGQESTNILTEAFGGGGGGYWTGLAPYNERSRGFAGQAVGGTSYISGHTGCVAITSATDITPKSGCETGTTNQLCSIHYSNKIFTDTIMIDGGGYAWQTGRAATSTGMPNYTKTGTITGNSGNGYAIITFLKG